MAEPAPPQPKPTLTSWGGSKRMIFVTKGLFQCYLCCYITPAMIRGTSLFLSIFTLVIENCNLAPNSLVFGSPIKQETFQTLGKGMKRLLPIQKKIKAENLKTSNSNTVKCVDIVGYLFHTNLREKWKLYFQS